MPPGIDGFAAAMAAAALPLPRPGALLNHSMLGHGSISLPIPRPCLEREPALSPGGRASDLSPMGSLQVPPANRIGGMAALSSSARGGYPGKSSLAGSVVLPGTNRGPMIGNMFSAHGDPNGKAALSGSIGFNGSLARPQLEGSDLSRSMRPQQGPSYAATAAQPGAALRAPMQQSQTVAARAQSPPVGKFTHLQPWTAQPNAHPQANMMRQAQTPGPVGPQSVVAGKSVYMVPPGAVTQARSAVQHVAPRGPLYVGQPRRFA